MKKIRNFKEIYNKLLKIKVNFQGDENQGVYQLKPLTDIFKLNWFKKNINRCKDSNFQKLTEEEIS